MSKEKTKMNENPVGANCIRPNFEGIAKRNKGITLIALIITIIVMLILVAVSVTVALNGGLFSTANDAKQGTIAERDNELALDNGQIEVDGKVYASYQDYLDKKPILPYKTTIEGLAEGVTLVPYDELTGEFKTAAEEGKITAVLKETITLGGTQVEAKAVIPAGYTVSTTDGEDSISEGLVIYDGTSETSRNNEFVWIPVEEADSYVEDSFGPLEGEDSVSGYTFDSQEELDYYYGKDYYNYDDFTYEIDKTNVETSIKTYGGFYVGRYETTIDNGTIGVQKGKTVLTEATLLKEGTNETSNDEYHYRWWGLYKAQKDVYKNNRAVGSLMLSSKQWGAIMTYTGYGDAKRGSNTYANHGEPDLSGSAYSTDSTQYDVSKNIYDLAGNLYEFSISVLGDSNRFARGSYYSGYSGFSATWSSNFEPTYTSNILGSRIALYIK